MQRTSHSLPFWLIFWVALLPSAARAAETPAPLALDLGGGVRLEAVFMPPGEFTQGSPADEASRGEDEAQRKVTLSKGFYIGRTAVTRAQWERFVQETGYRTEAEVGTSGGYGWDGAALSQRKEYNWRNPGFAQTPNHPVCLVTAPDAEAFCRWLAKKTGRAVSQPTEAQWEYACRAGMATPWHNGATMPTESKEIAWSKLNANNATHPVDELKPNSWGLHIGGNVSEWCRDIYAPYSAGPVTDPLATAPAPGEKARRVLRGGSWNREAKHTRSAARYRADARSRNADIGFRVVLAADAAPNAGASATQSGTPANASDEPVAGPPVVVPKPAAGASGGWSALCCIAPVLAMFGYIGYRIVRAASPSRGMGSSGGVPSKGLAAGAVSRFNAETRLADDGFLVSLLGVAPRSRFHYEYQPADGGAVVSGFDVYEPGPQGHYVYTGGTPTLARVTRVDPPGSEGDSDFDGDTGDDDSDSTPPPLPSRSMGSSSRRSSGSSHHPSAY